MGTWIEIYLRWVEGRRILCRSLRGNVDRNLKSGRMAMLLFRRSLRGNVDRNNVGQLIPFDVIGRSLRGNVDRNSA